MTDPAAFNYIDWLRAIQIAGAVLKEDNNMSSKAAGPKSKPAAKLECVDPKITEALLFPFNVKVISPGRKLKPGTEIVLIFYRFNNDEPIRVGLKFKTPGPYLPERVFFDEFFPAEALSQLPNINPKNLVHPGASIEQIYFQHLAVYAAADTRLKITDLDVGTLLELSYKKSWRGKKEITYVP